MLQIIGARKMVRISSWILLTRCFVLSQAMSAAVSFACPTGPFVRSEIESRTEALPGAAATIVCSNGSSWTGVYGEAALGSGRPLPQTACFRLRVFQKPLLEWRWHLLKVRGYSSSTSLCIRPYRPRGLAKGGGQSDQFNAPGFPEFGLAASQLHEFHRRAVGLRFDDQKASSMRHSFVGQARVTAIRMWLSV